MVSFSDIELVRVGFFQKPHGISGALLLLFDSEWSESIENAKFLFIYADGLPVPWAVHEDGISIISSESALVNLLHMDDAKSAKKLCGKDVYLERPVSSGVHKDETHFHWVGFIIRERNGKTLGKIIESNNYSGNHVFNVETPDGILLVPYHPDLVIDLDIDSRILVMDLPAGLQ